MHPAPLRPLRAARPVRVARAALVLVSLGASPAFLDAFAPNAALASWTCMLLSTGLAAWLVASGSLRARDWTNGIWIAAGGGALLGWLNAVLCFLAYVHLSPAAGGLNAGDTNLVLVWGALFGGLPGLLFGVAFSVLLALLQAPLRQSGPEAIDNGLFWAGAWMVATMVALGALSAYWLPTPHRIGFELYLTVVHGMLPAAVSSVGVLLAAVATWRVVHRRFWLRRVRAGHLPSWEVSALEDWRGEDLDGLQPLLVSPLAGAVLATVVPGEGYRGARRLLPVALVPDG